MDDESMNQYEKQLYTVFKTFDVNNKEALDRSAVLELCDALQLEDRGATLVNSLFQRSSDRVTFSQFRNGLLSVLGGAGEPRPTTDSCAEQQLPPSDDDDDDSSEREVAPKFVYGAKKYGRRSRPQRDSTAAESPGPRSSSASRLEDAEDRRARQRTRCRRSVSAMDSRLDVGGDGTRSDGCEPVEHDTKIDRDGALALCRGLHIDGIDRGLVERVFEDAGAADTTVGEFFERLNTSLTVSMEETSRQGRAATGAGDGTGCSGGCLPDDDEPGLPSELVLEAWESAGVPHPHRLLADLGFCAGSLRPLKLERALDGELRALGDVTSEGGPLPIAALALSRLRHERAARRAHLAAAERDKLRADVAEANERARLLAQEVDESHARIDAELKASIRLAERRHAEVARRAAIDLTADRETFAAARARLESEVARRAEAEARARSEAVALRERAEELEARLGAAEERAAAAEREGARLGCELRAALERGELAAAAGDDARELRALVAELRGDNARLRDRCDELCAALEASQRPPPAPPREPPGGDLSAELNSTIPPADAQNSSAEDDLLESFGDTEGGTPRAECETQTETSAFDRPEHEHEDEKLKLTDMIKRLELGLEQMRSEYESCEEYWGGKLQLEREQHEDELRAGDQRLADLAARVAEYERAYVPPARLPAIDERRALEAQVTDLQEEFAAYRRAAEAEAGARRGEARRGAGEARGEVRELRARCGRAEGAVRRLHARLAAADLLVKELYVENCHLAHRHPL